MSYTLPNGDPALPTTPNPYFQDNDADRGDQKRNNNKMIWANEQYLINAINAEKANTAAALALLPFRNFVRITSSQTWTNPGVTKAIIKAKGGGGGGGSSAVAAGGGGGGGSGELREGFFTITGNLTIVIGTGGAGRDGDLNGDNGGDTTISELSLTSKGGSGGRSAFNGSFGGAGGTGGTGGILTQNPSGYAGYVVGGSGGGLNSGHSVSSLGVYNGEHARPNSGDGGQGGCSAPGSTSVGGNGGAGYVDIYY